MVHIVNGVNLGYFEQQRLKRIVVFPHTSVFVKNCKCWCHLFFKSQCRKREHLFSACTLKVKKEKLGKKNYDLND